MTLAGAGLGGALVTVLLATQVAGESFFGSVFVAVVAFAVMAVVWGMWRRVGDASIAELMRGYTTIEVTFGAFRRGERRFTWASGNRLPWDYSGVWRLLPGKAPVPPVVSVDPPGFYPSPNRDGMFELWTGAAWAGDYVAPADLPSRVGR
jgi:hypothetical protein